MKNFPGTGSAIAARDQLAAAGITPRRDQAAQRPRRERRRRQAGRGEAERSARRRRSDRAAGMAEGAELARRGVRRDRRRRPRHPGDHRPRQREPEGNGRHAHRPRRRRPRLPARPVRQLPVRARARPAPDADPAHAGVPLARARDQGDRAEPPLARRRLRDHRLRLPAGPRLRALGHPRDGLDHGLDPGDDLRLPLRALDGLRGLHAHAHARGLRRDRLHRQGDRARARTNRQARDERRARAHVRLPRALDEPRLRDQAARDRPRRGNHLRRHRHPRPPRPGADEAPRRRELVDAEVDGDRPPPPAPRAVRNTARGRSPTPPVPVA